MNFFKMTDEEVLKIFDPIWDNLVNGPNTMNYPIFSKNFSKDMLEAAYEEEINSLGFSSHPMFRCPKLQIQLYRSYSS